MRFFLSLLFLTLLGCSAQMPQPQLEALAVAPPTLTTILNEETFTLPGTEQHISLQLSTSAASENGQVHWDDSQFWRFVVSVNEQHFELFDGFLALSQLQYWAYTQDDAFYITTVVAGTAQLTIKTFQYLEEEGVFVVHDTYATQGNVNMLRQTPSGL